MSEIQKLTDFTIKELENQARNSIEYNCKILTKKKLEDGAKLFEDKRKSYENSLNQLKNGEKHIGITCNHCLTQDFTGPRFVCSFCSNYNLCAKCEHESLLKQIHNIEHTMIVFNKPLNETSRNYNNKIKPNYIKEMNPDKNFKVEIKIANCGKNPLTGCYFVPIKYGPCYLTCKKLEITEEDGLEYQKIKVLSLDIQFPKDHEGEKCKGFFRMFTKDGLPFGDILTVETIE